MTNNPQLSSFSRWSWMIGGLIGLSLVALALVYFVNPFRTAGEMQVLDRTQSRDGNLILLAQRYNGSLGEPSTVTVYQQLRSNLWIGYYVDHEATYWRSGRLVEKNNQRNRFVVLRGEKPVAEIDCSSHESVSTSNTQLVWRASLLDQSPLQDPKRSPQWLGEFKQ